MTIRGALFIDGAWTDSDGDSLSALVTLDEIGIEMRPYTDQTVTDVLRLSFEEFAAIAELVAKAQGQGQGPRPEGSR